MSDEKLSAEEQERLRNLSGDIQPSPELRERTVRELRSRGVLQPKEHRVRPPLHWVAAAAALALACFAFGYWSRPHLDPQPGERLGASAVGSAVSLQQAATAYILELEAFAEWGDRGDPESEQGLEVARNALGAVAAETARLLPGGGGGEATRIVWF